MMKHYDIKVSFRGEYHSAHVQQYDDYCLVNFSSQVVLQDFTGTMRFEKGKYVPSYQRNKDAKDLDVLIKAIEKQLR